LINADPIKPLHPVMMTTSFSPMGVSNRTNQPLGAGHPIGFLK